MRLAQAWAGFPVGTGMLPWDEFRFPEQAKRGEGILKLIGKIASVARHLRPNCTHVREEGDNTANEVRSTIDFRTQFIPP